MQRMPVIIPRLADLEQAACHALQNVLARAVSAASARRTDRLHCAACSVEGNEDARYDRCVLFTAWCW